MKCLNCGVTITDANRQQYIKGFGWLPYCRDCTDAYNFKENPVDLARTRQARRAAKKLRRASPAKRREVYERLLAEGHKPKDVKTAWRDMGIDLDFLNDT